ncbi:hypothetical protein NMG60_11013860 [Bertholletia excelsa]
MSNISGDDGSFSSVNTGEEAQGLHEKQNHFDGSSSGLSAATNSNGSASQPQSQQPTVKTKRKLPGTPDPTAEVVALSPTTLMATNRFVCEICNKGFQRDQNLQLHRRGHNLPWKLRQRTSTEVRKRVYICPEPSCVHHNPGRALGDLTGIKKHYSRKHGEKKWKCDKCSKKYAVQSDWKAHQKTCGTREYKCDCGTIFSRRDSFITHRAFCDALAEENNKANQGLMPNMGPNLQPHLPELISSTPINTTTNSSMPLAEFSTYDPKNPLKSLSHDLLSAPFKPVNFTGGMFSTSSGSLFGSPRSTSSPSSSSLQLSSNGPSSFNYAQDSKNGAQLSGSAHMSATALLQKAAQMGATASNCSGINSPMTQKCFAGDSMAGPFNATQQHGASYESFQTPPDQPTLLGINGGGFANPTHLFDSPVADGELFAGMFSSSDQFIKKAERVGDSSSGLMRAPAGPSRFSGAGANDVTTVDFLGVGGVRNPNLHEQQRMQVMGGFHQQQLSQGNQAAMERSIWDV